MGTTSSGTDAPTTTAPTTGSDPAAIAARFTVAYFTAGVGDTPEDRRRRCRPLDTDALDELLGNPTWNGAGANIPLAGATTTVTIQALNPVETDSGGVGYELIVVLIPVAAGHELGRDRRGVEIWVERDGAGNWRVSQISVT